MANEIHDPFFGKLRLETFWQGQIATPLLGSDVEVRIDTSAVPWMRGEDEPPSAAQQDAMKQYLANEGKLRIQIEASMSKFLQEARERNSQWMDADELQRSFPITRSSEEVWGIFTSPSLFIPRQPESGWKVIQSWKVPWRPPPVEFVLGCVS